MARTPEGKVKDKCTALLKQYRAYYFFPMMGGFARSGIPDIIVCHEGKFLGVECKAGRNTTTPLQEAEMLKIREAGGSTLVINEDNIDQLEHWLQGEAT